ncbi:hypothetical protein PENTCL1PPCAC_3122, partial [Pristionchus entomophagus]
ADGRRGSQCLYRLQILDQTILRGHPLSGESETHGHRRDQTLRHIGHDDTYEENDGGEPVISQDERNDEEGNPEEDGNSRDEMDEMLDLTSDRSHSSVQSRGKMGDSTHHRVVSRVNHDSLASSLDSIGREECNVARLQRVLIRAFRIASLRLRLTS